MRTLLAILLAAFQLDAMDPRVTAWQYIQANNGDVVYVPTWGKYDANHKYNIPANKEILYLRLNTSNLYYELWSCGGTPGAAPANICAIGTQTCISCTDAFKILTWGSAAIIRSVGECEWFPNGLYVACSVQDANSRLAGFGFPLTGKMTGDPGIGGDGHIIIYNAAFTAKFQVDSAVCASKCNGSKLGLDANNLHIAPMDGTRGGWFVRVMSDSKTIYWANNTGVQGLDNGCTVDVRLGVCTEISIATFNPGGAFPGTATVTVVNANSTGGITGGIDCSGAQCVAAAGQYFFEPHGAHPTNPNVLLFAAANLIQTGAIGVLNLAGSGSVKFLTAICGSPFLDTAICNWIEHCEWSADGVYVYAASTQDTGPVVGAPTASPVWAGLGKFQTYPPFQEVTILDQNNINGIGRIKMTGFNDSTAPEFVSATAKNNAETCHNRYAALVASPEGKYLLGNIMQTNIAGGNCAGGKGITFVLFTIQQPVDLLGGAQLFGGASIP